MRWTPEQLTEYLAKHNSPTWVVPEWAMPEDQPDPGPESVLQGKIEAWCREWGRPYLSFRQSKRVKRILPPGWPDMEIIMPNGKTLRIELKSGSGRMSDDQKRLKLQFMALGHEIHVVTSYSKFLLITKMGTK